MDDIFAAMSQERLEASLDIDRRSAREIVQIIQEQDALVAAAVAAERDRIAHAIDQIADRLSHGGRLFYVGAGTSGRLGVLDASECPPTFRSSPSQVQAIIAGTINSAVDASTSTSSFFFSNPLVLFFCRRKSALS